MKMRTTVAFCIGLIAVFSASCSLAQVYDPTYQQVQSAIDEANNPHADCFPNGASFVGGAVAGVSVSACPAIASLLGHYKLSDFYGHVSVEVSVGGQIFFNQTLNSTNLNNSQAHDQAYLEGVGAQFNDLFNLGSYGNFTYNGTQAVSGVVTIEGLRIVGSVAANSTTIYASLPQLTKYGPNGFQLVGTGPTREAAAQDLVTVAKALPTSKVQLLEQSVLAYWAQSSSTDLLAGNPTSAQGIAVRNAMNLAEDDSVLDGEAAPASAETASKSGASKAEANAGSWLIGAAYGQSYGNGSSDDNRVDADMEKNWRIFEGQRTRLQLTIPVSYSYAGGRQAFQGGAAIGLEQPVLPQWSLEPQLSWGFGISNKIESIGHIAAATLTSRYRIDGVGRGYFIVGDMVGYTETLSTAMFGTQINPRLKNWVFRNGVAYELPLDYMVFGRGASVRASYVFTNYTGDPLYVEHYSEASLSFGVRSREGQLHNTFEALRLGVTATWGPRYNLLSGAIGFRF
jgi:hypothetical protein